MDPLDEMADQLYDRKFRIILLSIAYGFTHRKDIAEDIVADSIAEIVIPLKERKDDIRNLKQFAKTVVFRKALKWSKSKSNKYEMPPGTPVPDIAESVEPYYNIDVKQIYEAVKSFREEVDYIIFEMYQKGFKSKEMAGIVHMTDGAVRKNIYETLKWLRKHFRNERRK